MPRVEEDEGQHTAGDCVKAVAPAVEDERQTRQEHMERKQGDPCRDQSDGDGHRRHGMMPTPDQHLEHAGSDLRRPDQRAETHGFGRREATHFERREKVD